MVVVVVVVVVVVGVGVGVGVGVAVAVVVVVGVVVAVVVGVGVKMTVHRVRTRITTMIREDPGRAKRVVARLLTRYHGCLRDVSNALKVHHNTVYTWVAVLRLRRYAAELREAHGVKGPRDARG